MAIRTEGILSLCSGGGGLDLGVHLARPTTRVVCCVEHEASAAELLATRMEEGWLDPAPLWTDIRTFDGGAWRGRVQGIIAGIPCQPHSVAGKQLGEFDPRDLWPETAIIIRDISPDWVFLENVPGILRYYHDRIRPQLHDLGYRTTEGIFSAAEVGAPHRRERLFILAHAGRTGTDGWAAQPARQQRDGGILADTGIGQLSQPWRGTQGRTGAGSTGTGILGDTEVSGLEGRAGHQPKPWRLRQGSRAFPPGPGDSAAWARILAERPDLAPAIEPPVRGVAPGLDAGLDLPRAARLRLTGNGVVPAQAALAFRTLWRQLHE